MTAFLEFFITFAALCIIMAAIGLRFRIPAGLCPLAGSCFTILWFTLWGFFDLLAVAGWGFFLLAGAALGWMIWQRGSLRREWGRFLTPSVLFFWAASVLVIVYFAVRQPIPMEWDEFSFWSIAPKVVKTTGHMYTVEPGNLRVTSYVPGLVMLDYAFQFLGTQFVPWKVFACYDILLFAVFAAVLCPADKKHWAAAAPAGVLCLLTPFLFTVYLRIIYVSTVYMSSYADIPMGILFGGAVVLYLCAEKKTPALLLAVAFAVTAESLTKDVGFALALIAAALVCFDLLFVEKGEVRLFGLKKWPARIGWCVILMGMPVAAFVGWALHMSYFLHVSRFEIGGAQSMGMAQMVLTGLAELCGIGRTEHFTTVMGKMFTAFYSDKLSMWSITLGGESSVFSKLLNGSGLTVVLVIFAVFAMALIAADRAGRVRGAFLWLWSSLGFVAYYIFIGFTYVYVFHDWQSEGLVSYNRYIYPYYLGWFLLALTLLLQALCKRGPAHLGRLFLLALCAVALWRFCGYVRPQLCVIDYPDSYFSGMKRDLSAADQASGYLTEDDRIFFVSQGDDGKAWFVYYYAFYPILTDYSLGGGTLSPEAELTELALPSFFTSEQRETFTGMKMTAENLCLYLEATGCTATYIDTLDLTFIDTYGHLFTDQLAECRAGNTNLYRITTLADGQLQFEPVTMAEGKVVYE